LRLKYKIVLLAVVPLLLSLALIAWAVQLEQGSLAERRRLQLRTAFMSAKGGELRHYVALALSTISPLYNLGRDDAEIKKQVMQQLANFDYGPDVLFIVDSTLPTSSAVHTCAAATLSTCSLYGAHVPGKDAGLTLPSGLRTQWTASMGSPA